MTHRWRWRRTQYGPVNDELAGRFGEPCRIFARGLNGSVGVEFADGYRVVSMRWALRVTPDGSLAAGRGEAIEERVISSRPSRLNVLSATSWQGARRKKPPFKRWL